LNVADIDLTIRLKRSLRKLPDPVDRLVHWWRVDATLPFDPGLRDKRIPIGSCEIVFVDLTRVAMARANALRLLESHPGGVLKVAEEVLTDSGDNFVPELQEHCDMTLCSQLLILDRVRVVPQWRGHGLGPIIAAHVIDVLASQHTLTACYPAPVEGDAVSGPGRARAMDALGRTWAKVGFEPFRNDIWVLGFDAFNEHFVTVTAQ
jgi:GNAT superfamily N-acetyltransferase